MSSIDNIIVLVYLSALFIWAIYTGLNENAEDFLILSRKASLKLVMFSTISTWVGIGTTVATAASGYDTGISLGVTAASGGIVGVMISAWFAPHLKWFGDRFKAHTIGDFFSERYSKKARLSASSLIFIVYILLTAAQFVGLNVLLEVWFGTQFQITIWFAAISTIIYTAFAGIKSDFYTDVIHFIVMFIVLFIVLLPVTLGAVGGIEGFRNLPSSYFDPFKYGGLSFFLAGLIFGAGSVFVTMELWQRIYASTSGKVAQRALFFSIIIIVAFYLVSTVFGMSAFIVNPHLGNRDHAIFYLMKTYLPKGFLGLGIAGFMAVFISTVNSTIMVASATLTKDFYRGIIFPTGGENNLLLFGRVSTLICGFIGLLIAIIIPDLISLSVNSMFMLLLIIPAVIGGFFWKKATAIGAISSIWIGLAVMIAFSFIDATTSFVPGFIASLITFLIISLLSRHSAEENLKIVKGWKEKKIKQENVGISI